ncbi:acyl-CoA thioesterase [Arhodomonas sp. AD133]|uniref:acyl-CoA thioesterase n=1 Tax=Arhodomonas sp. AD133 TaxID=3415009 RepID=UPI003EBB6578
MADPTRIRVRGFHLDLYGHVNNARYLEFLEEARWDQLREHLDFDWWQARNLAFVIANIDIDFRRPAGMDDELLVDVTLKTLGERSGVLHQRVVRSDGVLVAEADVTFVIFDGGAATVVPIEGEIRERLARAGAQLE